MPLGSVSGFGVASSSWWRWLVLVCLLGFCPWILSAQEQNRLQLAERYMQNGEADFGFVGAPPMTIAVINGQLSQS